MHAITGTRLKKAILLVAMAALGVWLAWVIMRLLPSLLSA